MDICIFYAPKQQQLPHKTKQYHNNYLSFFLYVRPQGSIAQHTHIHTHTWNRHKLQHKHYMQVVKLLLAQDSNHVIINKAQTVN